jgi:hypothetical protein
MLLASEEQIQILLVDYMRALGHGDVFIHIPNGGYRSKPTGLRFKKMGVTAGVSDLFFAYPVREAHGLWLEVKSKKGKLSAAQREWAEKMNKFGYVAKTCYGIEEGIDIISNYLLTGT